MKEDESRASPDPRTTCLPATTPNKKSDKRRDEEQASEARRKMEAIMSEQKKEEDKRQSGMGVVDGTRGAVAGVKPRGRKKSVGFANIVMVKTIGSDSMGFGPLKRVMDDDVPVEEVKGSGASRGEKAGVFGSTAPSTPMPVPVPMISMLTTCQSLRGPDRAQGWRGRGDADEYGGPLEEHPEPHQRLHLGGAAGGAGVSVPFRRGVPRQPAKTRTTPPCPCCRCAKMCALPGQTVFNGAGPASNAGPSGVGGGTLLRRRRTP